MRNDSSRLGSRRVALASFSRRATLTWRDGPRGDGLVQADPGAGDRALRVCECAVRNSEIGWGSGLSIRHWTVWIWTGPSPNETLVMGHVLPMQPPLGLEPEAPAPRGGVLGGGARWPRNGRLTGVSDEDSGGGRC